MPVLHPSRSFQTHSFHHISHARSFPSKFTSTSLSTFFLCFTAGLSLPICDRTTFAASLEENKMHSNSIFALLVALSLATATPVDYSLQVRGNTPSKPADIQCSGEIIGYRTVTTQVRYCSSRIVSFLEKHRLGSGLASVTSDTTREFSILPKVY